MNTPTNPVAHAFGPTVAKTFNALLPPVGNRTAGDYVAALHQALMVNTGSFSPSRSKTDSTPVKGTFSSD